MSAMEGIGAKEGVGWVGEISAYDELETGLGGAQSGRAEDGGDEYKVSPLFVGTIVKNREAAYTTT